MHRQCSFHVAIRYAHSRGALVSGVLGIESDSAKVQNVISLWLAFYITILFFINDNL